MTEAQRTYSTATLLFLLTLAVYLPVTQYGFIWDDEQYVEYNPVLRNGEGLAKIWLDPGATPQYYPLVHTSYWIEYRLWGLDARGYHTVNILVHALTVVALWQVLLLLGVPAGAWAAAIFAVHPVNVESVAWITERKNTLALLFYLAAAFSYLRYSLAVHAPDSGLRPTPWYRPTPGLPLFVLAMLSKTVACSLPAALVLVLWWKQGKVSRRQWLELAPFFIIGAVLGLLTVFLEKQHVGASGADWELSFIERCLIAGRALWFYAGKLMWPANLAFFYPRWEIDATQWTAYLYPLAGAGVLAAAWFAQPRVGRGPLVALLIFAGTLVPALGFFDVYPMRFSFVADHFQYLATPAFIALGVSAAHLVFIHLGRAGPRIGVAIGIAALVALSVATWRQQSQFRDLESLWLATLEKNPASWTASYNLGRDRYDAGRYAEAEELFRHALANKDGYESASTNLGLTLVQLGRDVEAEAQYRESIRMDPQSMGAHSDLALLLATSRDPEVSDLDDAALYAQRAVDLAERPDGRVLATLALVRAEQGQLDLAIEAATESVRVARASGDEALAREAANRLEFYRLRQQSE